ncbi:MAG: transcription antitermination factor NusB [Rickettsiales bacterium]
MNAPNPSLIKKSAARLAAVQCLYQSNFEDKTANQLIVERMGLEEDDSNFVPDAKLLRGIVTGTLEQKSAVEERLQTILGERWQHYLMKPLMRAVLLAATYELIYHPQLKPAIILNEYVGVASEFFDETETGFVNGALQQIAKAIRD